MVRISPWHSLFFLFSLGALAQQVRVSEELGWTTQPGTPAAIQRRIKDAAKQYEEYAPIPRIALYDVAFPKDRREYEALNKHAIVLVTAITQDPAELPLSRVYIRRRGQDAKLTKVVAWRSETESDSLTRKVFGKYREDAFYLLPIETYFEPGLLLLDYEQNRFEFILSEYPKEVELDFLASDKDRTSKKGVRIPSATIQEILAREFHTKLQTKDGKDQ